MEAGKVAVEPFPVMRRMDLFAGVSDATVTRVAAAMRPVSVPANALVCREGEAADAFYIVQAGTLLVTTTIAEETRELGRMGPGEFFGEVALIVGGPRTATVTAIEPAELWSLDTDDFWSLVAGEPDLADRVEDRARVREEHSFEVTQRDLAALMGDRSALHIGRDPSNDLVLDSPMVSRFHAVIRRGDTGFELVDQESSTGTFVNGRPIVSAALSPGDEIGVGDESFYFEPSRIVQVAYPPGLRIDASQLGYEVKGGVRLLHDIDLSILPGELVAILGGSGAGKSTLLNALAGMTSATDGSLRYNGRDAYTERERFRNAIGYVPQDDIVHAELSARSTMDYAAQLRLPVDTSRSERIDAVDKALAQLGLTERADLAVRGLSGGQRKRCSIGVELLTRPRAFFLDEPTSGLDPVTDTGIMRTLRGLADAGNTVVVTTHSTANLAVCDRVVFIAPGGYLAYHGSPQNALEYFDASDFETIYERLVSEATPDEWHQRFRATTQEQTELSGPDQTTQPADRHPEVEAPRRQGPIRQFVILTRRNIEIHTRSAELVVPVVAQPIALSLLIMALFDGNLYRPDEPNPGPYIQLLFLVVFVGFLVGLLNSVQEIVRETAVFRRERMVGLGVLPYVMSKVAFFIPTLLVVDVVIVGILRLSNRLPPDGVSVYAALLVAMFLSTVSGMAVGLMTSSMVSEPQRANDLLAVWIMPQVLFSGGLIAVDGMNIVGRAISHVAALRWAFEAFGSAAGLDDVLDGNPSSAAEAIQAQYGDGFSNALGPHWIILAAFILVPLALTALILDRRTRVR